jgi:hypothetical protein
MTREQKSDFDATFPEIQQQFNILRGRNPSPAKSPHENAALIWLEWEKLWQEIRETVRYPDGEYLAFRSTILAAQAMRAITEQCDDCFDELFKEYGIACDRHPNLPASALDGAFIIRKEIEEMWDEVKRDSVHARAETFHVVVTAMRFAIAAKRKWA